MKNIETKWLEDFLMLEQCRNFSQAAEQRNLSQSAFSRRISTLEDALGIKLFDRSTLPLQLTEGGKLFHSQSRSLLQQFQDNLDELAGRNNLGLPNIKCAAAHSLSLSVMPELFRRVAARQNNLIYAVESIDVDQAVNTLIEGKSDFIFSFYDERLMQAPFLSVEILQSKLYPVSPADEYGQALFNLNMPNCPLLNYTSSSYMGRLVNRKLSNSPHIKPKTVFISSMSEVLKNMVLNRQGIAWLPEYAIHEELAANKLCLLDMQEFIIPIKAYIYRVDTRLNNHAEQFWRIVAELTD
ncbi:DNA-binding transcriptional LysR family regulator [Mesocricetibacter intestinalis]|uniref:DNA-binding transcriptional LysR family regulator n=1 Tax=Mesocricetibacter intestinalis TaxID=1521930 RepID=A0A4R6VFI4_9PAST|nr:hypochlorite stress DNA-binding transcriptional regulator HypT [Mesocricetibacter intestinalis]TDQ59755.1 DNA-binding transcriptional LysR family regulator [Mesocricetibacter intestinalis]